ncbi:MAG: DUF3419 family protein [Verrucomicrobiales bacterium]
MASEVEQRADFSLIRYAQCWEDADVLLAGLDIQPGDTCLSIASAGDNAFAMLAQKPARVIALDLSAAQLACVELRAAAYRQLDHGGFLELIGSRPSEHRIDHYRRCRADLGGEARACWDARQAVVAHGIGTAAAGKFERYFALFRRRFLPLVHSRATVDALLEPRGPDGRAAFYRDRWDTWRWRLLFRLFFSRFAMGRLGRDPEFFHFAEGSVAERILGRVRHALTELDPAENPYLHWILKGAHGTALPYALREENFAAIRANLDALEIRRCSVEDFLAEAGPRGIDRFNLSDIFEYMSPAASDALFAKIAEAGRPGGRIAYWNMIVPRQPPASLAGRLRLLDSLSAELHRQDKAFFYSTFRVEEIAA